MSGEKNLTKLIASMTPVLADDEYVFCTLKTFSYEQLAALNPISTFQEKEGLTVVLTKQKADKNHVAYSNTFKCITLNVHSSLEAVGLTAAIATKLTDSNISANVIAGYYHDHVFVSTKDAHTALMSLKTLSQSGV